VPPGHAKSLLTCVLASLGVDQLPRFVSCSAPIAQT
jgi:hypothetical protein